MTPLLHEGVVQLGAELPFGRVPRLVAHFTGVTRAERTVRRLTEAAGAAYVAVQDADLAAWERGVPAVPCGPAVQLVSVDGAMVPLVGGTWGAGKTLAVGPVGPDPQAPGEVRPTELPSFSRRAEAEDFARRAVVEVHRRGVETAGVVAGVGDGAPWCQGFLALHRPDAVRILDVPHAMEYLSAAAEAAYGAQTTAAARWLAEQGHEFTTGDPAVVLTALRALPVGAAPDPTAATVTQAKAVDYLTPR